MHNVPVDTPNGFGYAFGQMPNGKICVAHGWKDLNDEFKANYKGISTNTILLDYESEDVHVSTRPTRRR